MSTARQQPKTVYLDYAAATPVAGVVLEAMRPFFTDNFANPSALTSSALAARKSLETARAEIASQIGAKPHQIIFTSGATEANNLAIEGVLGKYPDSEVLVSAVEHESVLRPAERHRHQLIPVDQTGAVRTDRLAKLINDRTVLISIIHTSNEIGTVQDFGELARIIAEVRRERLKRGANRPLLLHTDAVQSPLTLDVKVHRLGVDLMTLSAGKIYGPKGIGCLYVADRRCLGPMVVGGGQELGLRSGTEPVPLAVGFSAALHLAADRRQARLKKFAQLRQYLIESLSKSQPDIAVNAASRRQAPQIISLNVPRADGEALVLALDQRGIEVATGSACAASSDAPSHVLRAIGLTPAEAAGSLRLSLGVDTTKRQLDRFVAALGETRRALDRPL